MERIYYNLTQLQNGWLLKRPRWLKLNKMFVSVEEYYPTLKVALEAIQNNFDSFKDKLVNPN